MNTAYPLWSISVLVIFFYSLTFTFSRIGILSKTNHRKLWNVALLIAFLTTGLIGLMMVVKINYKLVMPGYDQLVGFHVGFGIGMAIIGFFHLWWHLSYYLKLLKHRKTDDDRKSQPMELDLDQRILKLSAFLLGSTTIVAQVILLREFLSVFSGNELVIGLVLANWMILTGIGAYLGKFQLRIKKTLNILIYGLLVLSILPFITAFLINFLKNVVFPVGALISVVQIFFASLFLLIPFCLLSGFLFTFIVKSYSEIRVRNEAGTIYGIESVGSMAGGLLSGLLFIFIFSSIESLLVLILINGLVLFLIGLKQFNTKRTWILLLFSIVAFISLFLHPENKIRNLVYPNQEVLVSKDSPQGNIVITRRENLWSVYSNNLLLFDSENFMMNEEAVHFPMVQHIKPESILLVSGGLAGQIAELKKYKPEWIDYVEDNRWLISLMSDTLKKMLVSKIKLHVLDPVGFIRKTTNSYDVAILNLSAPSTLQTNRFYTLEFFTLLKTKLNPDAVVSFGLPSPPNYLNQEAVDLNSTIYATLKMVFQHVLIIPGEKNYFLASDHVLTYKIAGAVQKKGIETRYVNSYYFDDSFLQSRGEMILSALNPSAEMNQNLKPVFYGQQLKYWLSQFRGKSVLMIILAGALSLFIFLSGNSPSRAMFITGFSASGLEILLLFGLQIYFGNIYLFTSFVFTGFMFGLAAGSLYGKTVKRLPDQNYLAITQILIGVFAAVAGGLLFSSGMKELPPALIYTLYLVTIIVAGSLTGFQFYQASQTLKGSFAETSGKTYSFDLFGSAAGALLVSVFLVPRLGILESVWIIGFVNLVFGMWLLLKRTARI